MDKLSIGFNKLSLNNESPSSQSISGVCMTMCPEEEIDCRVRGQLIHPLEATIETATLSQRLRRCDRNKMVKCYSRPAAGKDLSRPAILRPYPVLKQTVEYLLRLSTTSSWQWGIVYDFVADRLRSVRQDIIIQELDPFEIVDLLGPMLLFYFYSKTRCETEGCSSYDSHLHSSQMDECADRFAVALMADRSSQRHQNRFDTLLLLYRLKSFRTFDDIRLLVPIRSGRNSVIRLVKSYHQRNFVKFFRIFGNLPLPERLAVSAGINVAQLRRQCLRTMQRAYGRSKVPLEKIYQWLAFKSADDAVFCASECGYLTNEAGLVEFTTTQHDVTNRGSAPSPQWLRWPDEEMANFSLL